MLFKRFYGRCITLSRNSNEGHSTHTKISNKKKVIPGCSYNPSRSPFAFLNFSSLHTPTFLSLMPKICCSFENLAFDYFLFTALYSADKFSNERQIFGLISLHIISYFSHTNFYRCFNFQEQENPYIWVCDSSYSET